MNFLSTPSCSILRCVILALTPAGAGYLKTEDVRRICHNLGLGLTHRIVKELCTNAGHNSNSSKSDRIDYKHLTQEKSEKQD